MHFNDVPFPNKTINWFPNKTRNLSLLPLWTVSARQGPVLGPVQSIRTTMHVEHINQKNMEESMLLKQISPSLIIYAKLLGLYNLHFSRSFFH